MSSSATLSKPPLTGPVVVSIQSQLVYGCAGNSAAEPVLQALGALVFAVPTILLSNTPFYPTVVREAFAGEFLDGLLDDLLERVDPTQIDAILTGYMGSVEAVESVARFIDKVRLGHPDVVVHIDPVMGDLDTGLYVQQEVADALLSTLVPRADILTPNAFESPRLTAPGLPSGPLTPERLLPGCRAFLVIDTGSAEPDTGTLLTTVATRQGIWQVRTPEIDHHPTGTGDCFAATFLVQWLVEGDVARALALAVQVVSDLIAESVRTGFPEMTPSRLDLPASIARAELLEVIHEERT